MPIAVDLSAWVVHMIWPLCRVGALLMVAPVFSSGQVPMRVRAGLSVATTALLLPSLPMAAPIDPLGPLAVVIIVRELLIGIAMGLMLRLVFAALEIAGTTIANQIGLGFAAVNDPAYGNQIPVLSQFYLILGTLLFLVLDAHLLLLAILARSFEVLPPGQALLDPAAFMALVGWGSQMFAGALLIGLPAIAALMVVNMAFGVMSRAAPQLNAFAVGFPIGLLLGLVVLMFGLPAFQPQFSGLLERGLEAAGRLVVLGSGG
jgi:flagellar biosynthetic protein FliR